MRAPQTAPAGERISSVYFPKRDELSFMTVQALPNASSKGLTCKMRASRARPAAPADASSTAWRMMSLADSVFPALCAARPCVVRRAGETKARAARPTRSRR